MSKGSCDLSLFFANSQKENYKKHKCAPGYLRIRVESYLRIRVEIFNYLVVLIDIMIVMSLEASLTNRSKPAATFVEDVLVHAHCRCTCTPFGCIHSWHNNVSVHTRALLVYIHFFVSHSSVHEAKSLSLQISNFSNSEGICAHIYDSMMENYSHDSTPRSQMISKSLYVCGSHSKNLIWICRPLPLPQKWCPSDQ